MLSNRSFKKYILTKKGQNILKKIWKISSMERSWTDIFKYDFYRCFEDASESSGAP